MIERHLRSKLLSLIANYPAVALLGPRQVGKTTLAHDVAGSMDSIYLDLESVADRAKLSDPELYLADHEDKLVILDEVHRLPELFQNLRGLIDRGRRKGRRAERFLLLGSASMDLLQQSGESLAGRIAYLELPPLGVMEIETSEHDKLWIRGGFPDSFLASDETQSMAWRQNFIRTCLERDVPQLGPRIAAETLRRFWVMLAHTQGGMLNASSLARGLDIDGKTVARYLDLMVDLLLVRRLPPWRRIVRKRLLKSPKIFLRDSGVAHALLGLGDKEAVLGHPIVGHSWEAFVIENLINVAPEGTRANFYRASGGAEIDLILTMPGRAPWAIEIKRSLEPKLKRGFYHACAEVMPEARYAVYPGEEHYSLSNGAMAINVVTLARKLIEIDGGVA